MTITYPLSVPTTNGSNDIQSMEIQNVNAVVNMVSPFSGAQQIQAWSRNQLIVKCKLIPMLKADAMNWFGFFRSLRSSNGSFYLGDPHNTTPQGTASSSPGTPLIAGADQTGNTLTIDGAPNSQTGWLLRGDWIQIGSGSSSRLYTITADVDTDGSGNATLDIQPAIRTAPADNDPVTVSSTVGVFRLVAEPIVEVSAEHFYSIEFQAMEVVS